MEGHSGETQKMNTHVSITVPEEYPRGLRGWVMRMRNRNWRKIGENMKENLLLILLLGSVILGAGIGFAVRSGYGTMTKREIMYLQFPGEILMRMLKMLILPLVISSLIAGIAGLDASTCGKMGLRTIAYFATTTLSAVILGIIMTYIMRPGSNSDKKGIPRYGNAAQLNPVDTFLDLIRNMFPDNLVEAAYTGFRSQEHETDVNITEKVRLNSTDNETLYHSNDGNVFNVHVHFLNETVATVTRSKNDLTCLLLNESTYPNLGIAWIKKFPSRQVSHLPLSLGNGKPCLPPTDLTVKVLEPGTSTTNSTNILGLVVFAVLMGVILGRMKAKGKPLVDFCNCLADATMNIFVIFIWYSPVGIAFLIAGKIVEMEDFGVMIGQVGVYFLTVLLGLLVHGSCVLPLIFFALTRQNPYKFIYGISQALATAFGTSSSSATMPVTLHCLEVNNHVDPRVSTFVIPVGATINMDGTALYEAVAALFIANVNDITMNFGNVVTISITATAASIGAAGVPQAGLVTMVIVLSAVGLPVDDITLILVVDWFLDRFRTFTNVMGDSLGAGIVYHLSKNELPPLPDDTEPEVPDVCVDSPVTNKGASQSPGLRKGPNGAEESDVAAV